MVALKGPVVGLAAGPHPGGPEAEPDLPTFLPEGSLPGRGASPLGRLSKRGGNGCWATWTSERERVSAARWQPGQLPEAQAPGMRPSHLGLICLP